MEERIMNLTGTDITVMDENGKLLLIKAEYEKAKVEINRTVIKTIQGIEIVHNEKIITSGIPDTQFGVYILVSKVVADALRDAGRTKDVLVPDELERNGKGKPMFCKSLAIIN